MSINCTKKIPFDRHKCYLSHAAYHYSFLYFLSTEWFDSIRILCASPQVCTIFLEGISLWLLEHYITYPQVLQVPK